MSYILSLMYIGLHVNYRHQILMKGEFCRQIFETFPNTKNHENPFTGNQVVPCRQTDRHGEASSLFSQFCERILSKIFCKIILTENFYITLITFLNTFPFSL